MEKRFVIVTENLDSYKETQFHLYQFERDVLKFVADANNCGGLDDQIKVKRIFKFDEWGKVKHYRMVLDGFQFKLEEIKE